jgi:hypothetical protein
MEKITKECLEECHVPVDGVELFDPDIIGSPLVTRFEHAG